MTDKKQTKEEAFAMALKWCGTEGKGLMREIDGNRYVAVSICDEGLIDNCTFPFEVREVPPEGTMVLVPGLDYLKVRVSAGTHSKCKTKIGVYEDGQVGGTVAFYSDWQLYSPESLQEE